VTTTNVQSYERRVTQKAR